MTNYDPNDRRPKRKRALIQKIALDGKEAAKKLIKDFTVAYTHEGAKPSTFRKLNLDLKFVEGQE